MNRRLLHVALAISLMTAACARADATGALTPAPTISETVNAESLPSAAPLSDGYPVAEGIEDFEVPQREQAFATTVPTTTDVKRSGREERCRGYRVTDLLFTSGEAGLSPEGVAAIESLAAELPLNARIRIVGHTDDVPIAIGNQRLSELRAEAVATELAGFLGDRQRIVEVVGRGERDPIGDNATDEGQSRNRRVEVLVNCGGE